VQAEVVVVVVVEEEEEEEELQTSCRSAWSKRAVMQAD
jgi:hypothetical protein